MKIKICGITNLADAQTASALGADLLGFNFYIKSPRHIDRSECAAICSELERSAPHVMRIGVFVNQPPAEVLEIMDTCGLHLAQLSGDEPLSDLATLAGRAFKALRFSTDETAGLDPCLDARYGAAPAGLVDASVSGQFGGTGKTADWSKAGELARRVPILLAGGLTPGNVAEAVRQVRPWGVDVASGVESGPGIKDPGKIRDFIENARSRTKQENVRIEVATKDDLPEILALQKLAYRSEAELNDDFTIPPLVQTQVEIEQEFTQRTFLKATQSGKLIGSVRADLKGGTCFIGRVIVHPGRQNLGIGTQLMNAIESQFNAANRYELFTSERSSRNLFLYQKLGYRIFKLEKLSDKVKLIYLEKGRNPS